MPYEITNYDYIKAKVAETAGDVPSLPWFTYPCLRWNRGKGQIWTGERYTSLTRVAYELANGPIPEGHQIARYCFDLSCFRPSHLHCSTQRRISQMFQYLRATLAGIHDDPTLPWQNYPCVDWPHGQTSRGYGHIAFDGHLWSVSRLAYVLTFGPLDGETDVCHHCDRPLCYRVSHLFAGSAKDNMRDMRQKGRDNYLKGELHGMANIKDRDAIQIHELRSEGLSYSQIAKRIGTDKGTVARVVTRRSFKHVVPLMGTK